ncbi:hypothetical protein GEU84_012990 [Fertoebacter nigrum]|uniref:Mitochondrial inner membrane protein n=1 Tax=Fertoeibacter niger TaxID=2656921 RepID=A0A8X8KRJ3_9RHOB|nr:hypothetical protein [Fertoeibacter niger]NUB45307.1 hypothetical protein [Fertoeibacter niger]
MADTDPRPTEDATVPVAADTPDSAPDPVILPEPERDLWRAGPDEAEIMATLPPASPPESAAEPSLAPRQAESPVAAAPQKRGGFAALLAGGVIAAGLGFGLAQVVPNGWPIGSTAELEAALAAQATETADLKTRIEALAARPEGIGDDALAPIRTEAEAAGAAATAASDAVAALDPRLAALEDRLTALENRPAGEGGASSAALSNYEADLAALRAELEAQKGAGAALVSDVEAAAKAAEARLAEAEAQAATLTAEAEALALAATTAAAVARVQAALDSGAGFADPLADLTAAGLEVPPILAEGAEGGLPTMAILQSAYPDAARAALEASLRADMGDSLTERLGSFLRSQTGARSLAPREGADPDAILSRAEAALVAEDLPLALQELAALPPDGQAAMAEWTAEAQRRIDATAAVASLATAAETM